MAINTIQGVVGPLVLGSGQTGSMRLGKNSDQMVSALQGDYYENAYNGRAFFSYTAAGILSAAGTAMTGHILWNGSASVNLAIQQVALQVVVTSASMTGIAMASGTAGAQTTAPTSVTTVTRTGSMLLGAASSAATPYSVATTLATTALWPLMHNTAAINTVGGDAFIHDFKGGLIVPPYTVLCLAALGAASAAAAVVSSISWVEVAI